MILIKKIGALTSKVYAFKARPWETSLVKSIDICDNLGFPLSVESKNSNILRVLPRYSKHFQLEWCSDKSRYIHEANNKHRLAYPSALNHKGRFQQLKSQNHQKQIAKAFLASSSDLSLVLGRTQNNENLYKAKVYGRKLGADICSEFVNKLDNSFAFFYSSTQKLNDLDHLTSVFFLGINPRWESTIANLLFRFRFLNGNFQSSCFGNGVDLTFGVNNFGSNISVLSSLSLGKHGISQKQSPKSLLIYGDTLAQRKDAMSLRKFGILVHTLSFCKSLFLSCGANLVGSAHLGLNHWKHTKFTYFVGAEEAKSLNLVQNSNYFCETPFVHKSIKKALFLQPIQTYLEKNASYIRYDGVMQTAYKALNFGVAALKPISDISAPLAFNGFFSFLKKVNKNKYFLNIHTCDIFQALNINKKLLKIQKSCLKSVYGNPYITSSFIKSSPTLLNLAKLQQKLHWSFLA